MFVDDAQAWERTGADRPQPARLTEQLFDERERNHPAELESQLGRLQELISLQADELTQTHALINKIIALCDLAEWAASTVPDAAAASVLTDDIRYALRSPAE
jgi:hypothetical protein